jgi:hypothetical protein
LVSQLNQLPLVMISSLSHHKRGVDRWVCVDAYI